MIKLQVIGNLGKDAELRTTASGDSVLGFGVAHTEKYTTAGGEKKEKTIWVDVSVWGKRAESLAPYLTKGKTVYVEGTPSARGYASSDGEVKASLQLNADKVEFLGGGNKTTEAVAETSNGFAGQPAAADDLPF
jgi:single-strand DNA-binding protein